MKKLYILIFSILISGLSFGQTVFINEIHYDNTGSDLNEGVEIAGPAGTDLTGYTITPYNGNGGATYTPITSLSGIIPDEGGTGYGTIWFPIGPLQNGAPDGIALDNSGSLIQFISYEGSFTATNGVASGVTSTDIVVSEAGTVEGSSLQLTGTGSTYTNFSWATEATATPGTINSGQTFGGTPVPTLTIVDGPANGSSIELPSLEASGDIIWSPINFNVDTQANGGDGYISFTVTDDDTAVVINNVDVFDITIPTLFGPLTPEHTYSFVAELLNYDGSPLDPAVIYDVTVTVLLPPTNSMVITGVFDVQNNSTPKGIELYVLQNIPDLSSFGVGSANNGGGTDGEEFTFPAVAANQGDYIYIVGSGQGTDFNAFFENSITVYESGAMFINGDDAIELFESNQVIDVFGDINFAGTGTAWDYVDGWAYRNDATGPDGNNFEISNWSFSGTVNLDGTTNSASTQPFPIGTYSTILNTDPTIAIFEGPSSGSTIDLSPEELSGSLEFVVTNFNVDTQGNGGDGYIVWTVINTTTSTAHDEGGPLYDFTPDPFIPLESNNSYYFVAQLISYTTSNVVAEYTLNINALGYTDVSSVAELRAVTDDGYYRLTNEALLTFQQSFRGQKFIQDATGGILIDDNNGRISSIYDINDGITNIRGQVSEFSGMKQLIPSADYGAPSSTGNTITPQTVTLADLTANAEQYESELVQVISVTIDNSVNTTFLNGTEYAMTQSSDNFNFRTTFYDVDYISATVPITATDIVGIVNERSGSLYYLTARNANDFSVDILSNDTFEANNFKFYPNPTNLGYINISSKNSARMDVAVFDILGKQVLNKTVRNNTLDVSGLTSGIYIMKVSQDNASITKKLVIQ
ncbi:T9SS type A sorting domain-containing protein [Gaetbulibacter aquiaggeris]|uniref:T9SS type A sorting domain-containing protein n=1 Tax=Gaetbulibacter aquiaggeris TaxID=1735373 RepID=A0ABW7MLJ1_9FLAO